MFDVLAVEVVAVVAEEAQEAIMITMGQLLVGHSKVLTFLCFYSLICFRVRSCRIYVCLHAFNSEWVES